MGARDTSQGVDMWSVGCMLGEMVGGQGFLDFLRLFQTPFGPRSLVSPFCVEGSAPIGFCSPGLLLFWFLGRSTMDQLQKVVELPLAELPWPLANKMKDDQGRESQVSKTCVRTKDLSP